MGYYSSYQLEIKSEVIDFDSNNVIAELRSKYEDADYAIDENGECQDSTKWYSCERDLKHFSTEWPSLLFIIERIGEENGDQEKGYFKNGKHHSIMAVLIFAEFSESDLK